MKILVIVIVSLVAIFIVSQFFISMWINKTEEQKYTVVHNEEDFEIRFYPAATLATIQTDAKTYKELSGAGFRKLAGYIFGGNANGTEIRMTAPVHMDVQDSGSTMSFVMPSNYNPENLPKPNDPNVVIKQTTDEYVAAIAFGGFASDQDLKHYSEKLQKILVEKEIKTSGHYRFLGYNPPFQLVGRRNEIIVSVEWIDK
jgi:hypothetical protein